MHWKIKLTSSPQLWVWLLGGVLFALVTTSTSSNSSTPLQSGECSWTFQPVPSNHSKGTEDKLDFSLSLFHSLYVGGRNIFFSPHSIYDTLLLTLLGSGGVTEAQLRKVLRVGESTSKAVHLQNLRADAMLKDMSCPNNGGVELRIATKLYLDKEETPAPCVNEHLLGKEVELLDIKNHPQDAINTINTFVENSTDGRIAHLLDSSSLSPSSRLAIVNAAFFRGVWEQQFKKSRTKLGLFYSSNSAIVPTHFMHGKGHFRHGASEELKAYILELPYEGGAVSMFLLLPPFTPNAVEKTIEALKDADVLRRGMEELVADSLEVVLPRFKLSHTLLLTSSLRSIGLTALFSDNNGTIPDLSGFSTQGDLSVEEGIHKATLEVGEEGATAAGATALIGTRSGRPLQQSKFVANHPFVILLWDKCRETLLFMGVLHNPGQETQAVEQSTNKVPKET